MIGLDLCPFAARVFNAEKIRYYVTEVSEEEEVVKQLEAELQLLAATPREKVETSFLIFPNALKDFLDFNDFTGVAEEAVGDLGLRGTIQVVGFHPLYQFEGTLPDSPENYTNRSPYPMLHLLREQSISDLKMSVGELEEIPQRNIQTLKKLGLKGILKITSK